MVATFNGWDDMPEGERELLERWEAEAMDSSNGVGGALPSAAPTPGYRGKPQVDEHADRGKTVYQDQ